MADMPDLSHLTEEERRIIEGVMMRQKQEEEQENEIMRRKADEVQILEATIRQRGEQHRKAGVELDATCHICLKTKFADGVGHLCNYCNVRCCARCGGKVTMRSNKVIWVCILCRKKQELLSKTGQWINKGMAAQNDPIMRKIEADLVQQQSVQMEEEYGISIQMHPASELYQSQYKEEDPHFYRSEIECLMKAQQQRYASYDQQQALLGRSAPSGHQVSAPVPAPAHLPAANPVNNKKHHKRIPSVKKSGHNPQQQQQHSFSSSDDEIRSTPECTSCEEHDSEKSGATSDRNGERLQRQAILDEKIKKFLAQHPLAWQPSQDGSRLIGRLLLKKGSTSDSLGSSSSSTSSASILGLKVIGGKLMEDGTRAAIIEKVKKGSIADIEGQLLPGDEVIEWNGQPLKGKSFQEVYEIIAESKMEPQVQMVISRSAHSVTSLPSPHSGMIPTTQGTTETTPAIGAGRSRNWHQRQHSVIQPDLYGTGGSGSGSINRQPRDKPSVLVTSPGGSPERTTAHRERLHSRRAVGGRMQIKLWYDQSSLHLVVTVVCAAGLPMRENGQPRNPYAKLFLLPDRR